MGMLWSPHPPWSSEGAACSSWGPHTAPWSCPRWLPGCPPSAPFLAQPVYLRGRSADGSHGRGLLRVLRGFIHEDFNVIIPGKKGKRPSLCFCWTEALWWACSAKANRQHHFLITHGPGDLVGTEPVSASLEKKELPSEQHGKKQSKSDPELQLKITWEGSSGSLLV